MQDKQRQTQDKPRTSRGQKKGLTKGRTDRKYNFTRSFSNEFLSLKPKHSYTMNLPLMIKKLKSSNDKLD